MNVLLTSKYVHNQHFKAHVTFLNYLHVHVYYLNELIKQNCTCDRLKYDS